MFDWSGYLELAKELGQQDHEQHHRSAISRAYYAAFNHARMFVERSTSIQLDRHGGVHQEVPKELRRMRPPRENTARKLEELKKLRTWADYRSSPKANLPEEVKKALAYAERVIRELA